MAETFSVGTQVTALWGHRWYAGVVDDIIDGGRAYEIAWAHEETCNEVPAADVRARFQRTILVPSHSASHSAEGYRSSSCRTNVSGPNSERNATRTSRCLRSER